MRHARIVILLVLPHAFASREIPLLWSILVSYPHFVRRSCCVVAEMMVRFLVRSSQPHKKTVLVHGGTEGQYRFLALHYSIIVRSKRLIGVPPPINSFRRWCTGAFPGARASIAAVRWVVFSFVFFRSPFILPGTHT